MKKTKRVLKKNRSKTQKYYTGGVIVRGADTAETAFQHFLENSTFKYFNRGFFGVTVLATLNDGIESKYTSIRMQTSQPETKMLLIKFLKLEKQTDPNIKVTTPEDIDFEVTVQQDIYFRTLMSDDTLLEPICPCVVHSSTGMTSQEKDRLHSLIGKNDARINDIFSADTVAYIAMEFMEGFVPLRELEQSPRYKTFKQMSLHMLDKMHMHGYLHHDFNDDNVLIHQTQNYYNLKGSGRAIIIDFSESTFINRRDRLKMMKIDCNISDPAVFKMFDKLDEMHNQVQKIRIESIEQKFNMKINDIMKTFVFYIGGGHKQMRPFKKIPDPNYKHLQVPPEFEVDLESDDIEIHKGKTAPEYEDDFKRINPEAYAKFMKNLDFIVEKKKSDPDFFKKLIAAQFNNLIVEK